MMGHDDVDDFGFTAVTESELKSYMDAEKLKGANEEVVASKEKWLKKTQTLYEMIMPMLRRLKEHPEKEYLFWPDREKKVNEFIKKLDKVLAE